LGNQRHHQVETLPGERQRVAGQVERLM